MRVVSPCNDAGTADTDFGPQLRDLADTMQVVSFDPRG